MPYKLEYDNEIMTSEVPFKMGELEAVEISREEFEELEAEKEAKMQKEEEKRSILIQLQEIDNKSIRALRANEIDKLDGLEAQAEILREELRKL